MVTGAERRLAVDLAKVDHYLGEARRYCISFVGYTALRNSRTGVLRPLMAEGGMPMVSTVLPREAASVPAARRLVRHTLADWRLPHLAEAAELVVAELAANAVQHTRHSVFGVTIRRVPGHHVRVAVTDKSRALPVLGPVEEEAVSGRGLAMVAATTNRWGIDMLPWGKCVWADLGLKDPEAPRPADEVPMFATVKAQALYILIVMSLAALLTLSVASDRP
ncbi:ATP-binding protein [Streptomyces sp. NPDC001093]|uniref:ATP-binding protein n=1 Tax=Streptomyces sp. NPDC001093 TaxID=3154376 RepID=UPI003328DF78